MAREWRTKRLEPNMQLAFSFVLCYKPETDRRSNGFEKLLIAMLL